MSSFASTAPPPGPTGFVPQGPPSRNGNAPFPPAARSDQLPHSRRLRRPGLAVAGALLVLLCGVTSFALATAGDDRLPVLALARDVQAGQVLSAADLRVARISGEGVSALAAGGSAAVVGQTMTATLPAGTLLNDSMLSPTPLPAAGLQLVAVAVKAGGAPVEATLGRDVTLVRVETAAAPTGGTGPTVLVARARVVSVQTETTSGLLVLSVQVPAAAAPAVAQANAAGALAVTLLPVAP